MIKLTKMAAVAALSFFAASAANAGLIDFESASGNYGASYTEQGVTFSVAGADVVVGSGPNGTNTMDSSPFTSANPFRADIGGGATAVSVDVGDFTPSDVDNVFLRAYNSLNALVDSAALSCCSSAPNMVNLSVAAADIAYVVIGSTGTYPNSVFIDNFAWDEADVPEPGTLTLLGLGLLGAGAARRRKLA